MAKFTRRQLLLDVLVVIVFATGVHEFFRLRSLYAQQATLTDLALRSPEYIQAALTNAYTSDAKATEKMEEIQASLNLSSPTIPYDREMSKILIQCSRLATEQYLTGKFDPNYDGSITALPTYSDRLNEFTQVASIAGPDQAKVQTQVEVPDNTLQQYFDPLQEGFDQVQKVVQGLAGQTVTLKWTSPVYWGFVLASERGAIVVYRGTQRGNEWFQTIQVRQIDNSQVSDFEFKGKVHHGFAKIYNELADPTIEAVRSLDPDVPLYISGHSLGSPLATLSAMDIALREPALKDQIRLYTYAGPRVGDPSFVEAHSQLIPNNYRVANLADPTTLVPPSLTGNIAYVHVGDPWRFITSNDDIGSHHYVSTYREAVDQEVETNQRREYPISGVD